MCRYLLIVDKKKTKDLNILKKFIEVYCHVHHGTENGALCDQCSDLSDYAKARLERCPHDPKPACKNCETHCYKLSYREQIKTIMRFSGIYYAKRGRIDWLVKYLM